MKQIYFIFLFFGSHFWIKYSCLSYIESYDGQVQYLSSIRHRNLVSLLGYCQESDVQMLVYEYIPNGSVSTHLYGLLLLSNVLELF